MLISGYRYIKNPENSQYQSRQKPNNYAMISVWASKAMGAENNQQTYLINYLLLHERFSNDNRSIWLSLMKYKQNIHIILGRIKP